MIHSCHDYLYNIEKLLSQTGAGSCYSCTCLVTSRSFGQMTTMGLMIRHHIRSLESNSIKLPVIIWLLPFNDIVAFFIVSRITQVLGYSK